MLRSLPPDMQGRYIKLAEVCRSIRGNFAQLSSTSQMFVQQMDQRLEGLLHGYARLLSAAFQQRQYVKTTDPDQIQKEIAALQQHMNSDPPRVQDINKKRVEILSKRLEKYQKITENRQVVDAQCSAVEDVLQLVRDQSVTMRDPQQVSDQLANLVHDVEQTEQTVQQVESIFSGLTPEMEGIMQDVDTSSSSSSAQRTRIGS
jgi:predicted transcriptional regulator